MEKKKIMQHCFRLAEKGFGSVAPNPMVGSIIVYGGKIIGKGYHKRFGDSHAEVNAINSVKNKRLLPKSTLYITLEPCNHYGKTPPCTQLVIRCAIPKVIVAGKDPNPLVAGKGIETLRKAGVKVQTGLLNKENKELNKRFFSFHEKRRPYIILKWAQTKDGFIDKKRTVGQSPAVISNAASHKLAHIWRSQEQAIMIGTNTAILDNPKLTVRLAKGKNPIRVVLDKNLRIPRKFHVFNKSSPTIVFTDKKNGKQGNIEFIQIDFASNILTQILYELYNRKVQSIIVEGGAMLLESFIAQNLWDEARIIVSKKRLKDGVRAPKLLRKPYKTNIIRGDRIHYYRNKT